MKTIGSRIWLEPAVAIGFLVSLLCVLVVFTTNGVWDAGTVVAVCAPLASALGIRQVVSPNAKNGKIANGLKRNGPG